MKSTRILSEGAMISAVTIAVVMMDSLCGGMITMAFPWVYAFPILVFSARRGLRAGALTMFASVLLAFFFTAWTTQYFLFFALLAGLIYGTLVHHESENIWKLLVLFVITTFSNLISMVLLAAVFGYDVSQDLAMYAEVLHFFDANGIALHLHAVTLLYFFAVLLSFLQTISIHAGASVLLHKMQIKNKKMKNMLQIKAPRSLGIFIMVIWVLYFAQSMLKLNADTRSVLQLCALCTVAAAVVYGIITALGWLTLRSGCRFLVVGCMLLAFVPIVNLFFALLGEADLLLQLRQRMLRGVIHETFRKF